MTQLIPYMPQPTILCVDIGGYAGCLKDWLALSKLVYTGWSNLLPERINKYDPDVLVWYVSKPAMTYRHICAIRAKFPNIPITLIINTDNDEPDIDHGLFIDQNCSLVGIRDVGMRNMAPQVQMAVAIACHLVNLDKT